MSKRHEICKTLSNTGQILIFKQTPCLNGITFHESAQYCVIVSTLLLRSSLQYAKCKERDKSDYYNKSVLFLHFTNIREYPNSGQSDLQPYHPCGLRGN